MGNTLSRQGVKYTQQAGGKIRSRLHQDPGALCCLRVNPSCYTGVLNLVAGGEAAGYTWGLVVVVDGDSLAATVCMDGSGGSRVCSVSHSVRGKVSFRRFVNIHGHCKYLLEAN